MTDKTIIIFTDTMNKLTFDYCMPTHAIRAMFYFFSVVIEENFVLATPTSVAKEISISKKKALDAFDVLQETKMLTRLPLNNTFIGETVWRVSPELAWYGSESAYSKNMKMLESYSDQEVAMVRWKIVGKNRGKLLGLDNRRKSITSC